MHPRAAARPWLHLLLDQPPGPGYAPRPMIPSPRLLSGALALALAALPASANPFSGLFGKKAEQQMPAQPELDRREAEARAMAAEAARHAANNPAKAAKINRKLAKEYPLSSVAASAAFEAGQLYERADKVQKAFESYEEFLGTFKADKRFQQALDRQFAIAMACKEGEHKGKVLGLTIGGVSRAESIEMLDKLIAHSPRSKQAAQARLGVADLRLKSGDVVRAVEAFQQVVDEHPNTAESAEAQFRIGQTYLSRAEQKSKDRTTVTSAREAFEDYLVENPGGERAREVEARLQAIASKEAKETFEIAKFYEKTGKPQAAAIYYREVLRLDAGELAATATDRLAALGAAGVKPPELPGGDEWLPPEDLPVSERDDYAGPQIPSLRPRLPALRYDPELLPEDLPGLPPSESPLLDDIPLPDPGPETPNEAPPGPAPETPDDALPE
jgi:outer membrane protein assembly factor BamD (BamD/ComL family)